MKKLVIVCFFTFASGLYTDVDETLNIDNLMQDPVKTKEYIDCTLDRKPCTEQMAAYKKHIKEIFETNCALCDDKFKHMIEDFILNAMVKYPEDMALIRAKYDPSGRNFGKLVAEVAKY